MHVKNPRVCSKITELRAKKEENQTKISRKTDEIIGIATRMSTITTKPNYHPKTVPFLSTDITLCDPDEIFVKRKSVLNAELITDADTSLGSFSFKEFRRA